MAQVKGGNTSLNGPINWLEFNLNPTAPNREGVVSWNTDEKTLDLNSGLGPVLQVGQEFWYLIYNDTAGQIDNGTILRPVGATLHGGMIVPTVEAAKADVFSSCEGTIMMATMNITVGSIGFASRQGRVRGLNLSTLTPGADAYLSATVAGGVTNTRPAFPNYGIKIGAALSNSGTNDEFVFSQSTVISNTFNNAWNGCFRESFDFRVTESGGTVTGTLTPTNGHPDMTMIFSDGFTMLDTSPGATIDLTSLCGTDTNPQTVYVYIPKATKVLTAATSDYVNEHIHVAQLYLQTPATVGVNGALRNQNWNDEIQSTTTDQGHLSHIGERIRALVAEWDTGSEGSLTGTTTNVYIGNTSGIVYQMHKQTFPALQMPTDDIQIINDSVTPYRTTTNLNDITVDAAGVTVNNKWFSIVVFGVCNKTGETSHIMCNLPIGSYNSEASAVSDSLGYSVYNIPKEFKGVAFLIARFTIRKSGAAFTYNIGAGYQDLRGFVPNSTAGTGAGASGITDWLALTDTPSSYVGQAGKVPRVNSGETALEFSGAASVYLNSVATGDWQLSGSDYYVDCPHGFTVGYMVMEVLIDRTGGGTLAIGLPDAVEDDTPIAGTRRVWVGTFKPLGNSTITIIGVV